MTIGNIQSTLSNATYTFADKILPEQDKYLQILEEKAKESEEKIPDDTVAIQTGKKSYTEKQWTSFLENYDEITERAREMMRQKHEKQYEQLLEREEQARQAVMDDYLETVQEAKRNRTRETQEYILEEEDKQKELREDRGIIR